MIKTKWVCPKCSHLTDSPKYYLKDGAYICRSCYMSNVEGENK